jgi:hypothetical protein
MPCSCDCWNRGNGAGRGYRDLRHVDPSNLRLCTFVKNDLGKLFCILL